MSPRTADYFSQHRKTLVREGACRFGATHGPALPMIGYCADCKAKQDAKNRKYRELRKRKLGTV